MRWFWTAATAAGFILAFMTHSPGLLALGLLVGFGSMFCLVFSMAADKIQSTARADSVMLTPDVLEQMRARATAQKATTQRAPAPKAMDEAHG